MHTTHRALQDRLTFSRFIHACIVISFRQALAQGLFMNVAEYFKENDYRTVNLNQKPQKSS